MLISTGFQIHAPKIWGIRCPRDAIVPAPMGKRDTLSGHFVGIRYCICIPHLCHYFAKFSQLFLCRPR